MKHVVARMQAMTSRRHFLATAGKTFISLPLLSASSFGLGDLWAVADSRGSRQPTDDELLDEIGRGSFRFFWEQAHPKTGLVKDRARTEGTDTYVAASIAAAGFGLTGLCIGDARGYLPSSQIRERVKTTLDTFAHSAEGHEGFFFHFLDWSNGQRMWNCELSSIDTALLLCGVLTARQYFAHDHEIVELATKINNNVNWAWMLNGGKTLAMGWKPESGFLHARWTHYCELMMMYLLGMGSPTHPLPPETWHAWTRPTYTYQGITYISDGDPLFTHQYSQAYFDFRNLHDDYADYFENSVKATKAHRLFCLSLHDRFPDYSDSLWGITASDSMYGYVAWGGPPPRGPIDGSVVPCATGGSIPFLYDDCMKVLRNIRASYPKAWGRYSYTDAFNPLKQWYNPDVLGIDLGITLLMAENQRTNFVWKYFMKNPEAQKGMHLAGFKPNA